MTPAVSLLAIVALAALMLSACGAERPTATPSPTPSPSSDGSGSTAAVDLAGSITVAGATSLTAPFTEIAADFAAAHPGVEVALTFGSSSTLVTQLLDGAPADVFASADPTTMTRLTEAGLVAGEPVVFAGNELVIVTKPGNPEGIESLADLADAGVISLCGQEVPCGRYAADALDEAAVTIDESTVTRGQNVGATLTAVTEGDAVAGIVYVTDARSAGDAVELVTIPTAWNVTATYPIAALDRSDHHDVAAAFVAYVLSDDGQAVLADHGFLPPP